MLETIGNTPVARLKRIVPSGSAEVWVKIEGGNPTGSYKDRMALAMVKGAETEGVLNRNNKIRLLECPGGSTGTSSSFCFCCQRSSFYSYHLRCIRKRKD